MRLSARHISIVLFLVSLLPSSAGTILTIEELRAAPNLTPEGLARYFSDFEFKFHSEVQDPAVFLRTRSGDCDDYATVAADVLSVHGYTPHLIAVRMKGETHVVCYVEETKTYLDYNYRGEAKKTLPCNGSLTDIARKVADSFGRDWVAAYEFTYQEKEKVKRLVDKIMTNRSAKAT